jgi:hypothetical protein
MTVGAENVIAARFLQAKLKALVAFGGPGAPRVFQDEAPVEVVEPFAVYNWQNPGVGDDEAIGAIRVWVDQLWVVRATKQTHDWADLEAAATAIDGALHATAGAVTGGSVVSSTRVGPFALIERVAGKEYRHLGGTYRLLVQGS